MRKVTRLFVKEQKGIILLTILILIPLLWLLWSITMDGSDGRFIGKKLKTALNRSVKGAVLAVDSESLAHGQIRIDETVSRSYFNHLLRLNLSLNSDLTPRSSSPLLEPPEILEYHVYQGPVFPFTYHTVLGVTHIFNDPGVLAVVKARFKNNFSGTIQEIYAYAAAEAKG